MTARKPSRLSPLLRIFESGSRGSSFPHWYAYVLRGVASGFCTTAGMPMLVGEACARSAAALKKGKAKP